MLVKRRNGDTASTGRLSQMAAAVSARPLDRRSFLRASGLTVGGLAALGTLGAGMTRRVEAAEGFTDMSQPIEIRTNICTHCSVGCTVKAEVQNGVWVGQEPAYGSPINRGTHCAKGASVRELVHGDRRIKYPMKKVGGNWERISWDQALTEISDKMTEIRGRSGADSVYLLGSAKFSNEGAYLFRKFAAFWGTNNVDHQARICHSTTVAGVANTWGYGAMTNSYNDIRNSKTVIFMGSNAAEAHPVSLQHILEGKETQRANVIVFDPRFTRTAAHATEYVRFRPGTDIAVIYGMLWHIFENGWEDQEFIDQRVWGMDQIREETRAYPPRWSRVSRASTATRCAARPTSSPMNAPRPSSGAWAARSTPSAPPTCGCITTFCSPPATSAAKAMARTSSAAIATCRAQLISASMWPTCLATTGLRRARGATGRGSGMCPTTTSSRASMMSPAKGGRDARTAEAEHGRRPASPRPAGSMRRFWMPRRSTSATTSRR